MIFFLWTGPTESSATKHGVSKEDAEYIVRRAFRPYPQRIRENYYRVLGSTRAGLNVEVIYVERALEEIAYNLLTWPMLSAIWENDARFYSIFHSLPR